MSEKGQLIIFSGPSGVGKGTVRKALFCHDELKLAYSISMTTRKPREGEMDGVDYFFVSEARFLEAIAHDELLEHACFVGNYYGTPTAYVERLRNQGFNVLLEIEVEGAKQVMKKCADAITIFLVPPSFEELETRIRLRRSESEEVIQQRLAKAKLEMGLVAQYHHVVVNNTVERAAEEIAAIIQQYQDQKK